MHRAVTLYILTVALYILIVWHPWLSRFYRGMGALYILSVTLYITHGSAIFGMGALCILSGTFYMAQPPSQSYIRLLPCFVKINKKQALVLPKGQGALSGT